MSGKGCHQKMDEAPCTPGASRKMCCIESSIFIARFTVFVAGRV